MDNSPVQAQTYGVYMGSASAGTIVANNILSPNLIGAFADVGVLNRIYGNSENNSVVGGNIFNIVPSDDTTHMNGTFIYNKPIVFAGITSVIWGRLTMELLPIEGTDKIRYC
jgi:hypothetical protein